MYTVWSFDLWVRHPGWFSEHLILKSSEQCIYSILVPTSEMALCKVGLIVVLTVAYLSHSNF